MATRYICKHCREEVNGPFLDRCPHCFKTKPQITSESYLTAEEKAQQAEQAAAAATILVALIPIVFALLIFLFKILWKIICVLCTAIKKVAILIFKLLTWWIPFTFKKPKIALPIEAVIVACIGTFWWWYNTPEQKFARAESYIGDPQRRSSAVKLIREASEKDYIPAMLSYADMLFYGKNGVKKDMPTAYALFSKAAEQGDAKAWYLKGACLENATGTTQNLTEAYNCYLKSKAAGFTDAQKAVSRTEHIAKYWIPAYSGEKDAQYQLGLCYASGNGIRRNLKIAREWFKKSADAGNPVAQVMLCSWLVEGRGGVQNVALGLDYCEKAAKQNYPEAFTLLGKYYFEGKVISRNYAKAIENFTHAAKNGSASAAFNLGFCFRDGYGTTKDPKKAFDYFKLASERKSPAGAFALGQCYEYGVGTTVDFTKALAAYTIAAGTAWRNAATKTSQKDAVAAQKKIAEIGKWWALANEKKDAQAQCNVGTCYFTGNGVTKDLKTALDWFRKAAAQNNIEGIVRVADCQFYGYGMPKDQNAAVKTYLSAAEKGQSHAMFRLGQCFEEGTGTEQNLTSAYNWFTKADAAKYPGAAKEAKRIQEPGAVWDNAIKKHDAEAQFRLAVCYHFGDSGLPKDLKKAFDWFKKSSEQGFVKSTHNLGLCYLNGYGTAPDMAMMKKCFLAGAEANYPPSLSVLGELYQKGIGVEQNMTTAYRYYVKAAASQDKRALSQVPVIKKIAMVWDPAYKGDAKAQHLLARYYYSGIGIEKDLKKTEEWLLKSANQGYADAQYDLAILYSAGEKSEDNARVIASWLQKASASGHIKAMVKLGQKYYTGEGVKEDYDKSVELWEKAVKANDADAMFWLGKHRFSGRGMFNSGKDVDKAVELWTAAEKLGHVEATYSLAEYYYSGVGLLNSGKDRKKSFPLYRKAAQGGHIDAMYKLGYCLYEGDDVKRDKMEGAMWLKKAAEGGNKKAQTYIEDEKIK